MRSHFGDHSRLYCGAFALCVGTGTGVTLGFQLPWWAGLVITAWLLALCVQVVVTARE